MKRILSSLLAVATAFSLAACTNNATPSSPLPSASTPETASSVPEDNSKPLRIAALKGPTAMGMAKLIADNDGKYEITLAASPDELVGKIIQGELDIAAVPTNLAATLFNKTEGGVKLAAINTLGVLYLVENGDTIQSFADLKGKTIYLTGKGSTPEFALQYLLSENGLTVGTDVFLEYKTEHSELATLLAADKATIALLPQPFVSSAMMQNEGLRIALDLTAEWEKVATGSSLAMGGLLVQSKLLTENKEGYDRFMADYRQSVDFMIDSKNLEQAASYIEQADILKAPVAKKALPYCSITLITGEKLPSVAGGFLEVLFNADPKSVGGKLPDESFYAK